MPPPPPTEVARTQEQALTQALQEIAPHADREGIGDLLTQMRERLLSANAASQRMAETEALEQKRAEDSAATIQAESAAKAANDAALLAAQVAANKAAKNLGQRRADVGAEILHHQNATNSIVAYAATIDERIKVAIAVYQREAAGLKTAHERQLADFQAEREQHRSQMQGHLLKEQALRDEYIALENQIQAARLQAQSEGAEAFAAYTAAMATVPPSPAIPVPASPMQALAQDMQGLQVDGASPVHNTGPEPPIARLFTMIETPLDTLAESFSSPATDALEHQEGLRGPAHVAGNAAITWLNVLARQALDNEIEHNAEQNRQAFGDSPTPADEHSAAVTNTAMDTTEGGQVLKKGRMDGQPQVSAQPQGDSDEAI